MIKRGSYISLFFILLILIFFSMVFGSIILSPKEAFNIYDPIFQLRFSKTLTAIVAGAGTGLSGLLLQTLFRNPLAGPSILGISSGATLGIAIGMSIFPFIGLATNGVSLAIMSILGSLFVVFILLLTARYVGKSNTLLIVGLMLSYFCSAFINIITFYLDKSAIQGLVFWGFGSFGKEVEIGHLFIYVGIVLILIFSSFFFVKKLDVLLLGDRYALSLGIEVKKVRFNIILLSGLLIGIITAWCGPIAFLGVGVPHLARNLLRSSKHFHVISLTLLLGAILAIFCDIVSRLPGLNQTIPLNAVTSIIGAPIIVWVIFRNKLI